MDGVRSMFGGGGRQGRGALASPGVSQWSSHSPSLLLVMLANTELQMIYFTDSPLADESVRQLSDVDPAGEQQAEETHRALPGEWKRTQKRNYFQHAKGTRRQS